MNTALPDASVTGHEQLIDSFELPDPDDRHVLAAAVRIGAQAIVTFRPFASFGARLLVVATRSLDQTAGPLPPTVLDEAYVAGTA